MSLVANALAGSKQALVPQQMISMGGTGDSAANGPFGVLLTLLTAEKMGMDTKPPRKKAAVEGALVDGNGQDGHGQQG